MRDNTASMIYLDNAATTPLDPSIAQTMTRIATECYGNPSSRHAFGLKAEKELRKARQVIGDAFGVREDDITFTSGATEAIALAILGTASKIEKPGKIIISAIEHPAVRETAKMLEAKGHQLVETPVDSNGEVILDQLIDRVCKNTFLVAIMHVNNEVGVTQNLGRIAREVKRKSPRCKVLADMVQSFGLLDTDLEALNIDLAVATAHKLNGPKGVGCLARLNTTITPLWKGGNQEKGLRSGTENVAGIVGFAQATTLTKGNLDIFSSQSQHLIEAIQKAAPEAFVLAPSKRSPHILSIAIENLASEVLVNALNDNGVLISSGSACHGRRSLRSHVLNALNVPEKMGVIRLSLSRKTSDQHIERAAEIIKDTLIALKR